MALAKKKRGVISKREKNAELKRHTLSIMVTWQMCGRC